MERLEPGPSIVELTRDTFKQEVVEDVSPILIDFWAPWCGPCRALKPILDNVAQDLEGKVRVGKVNVDDEPQLAEAFNIRGIPTLVLIRDKAVIDSLSGILPREALTQRVLSKISAI
ncbi:MAG: thioredoxin [Armatimonadetes bacterium]|nr:thioredoxin [Armatimonadota bacterium]